MRVRERLEVFPWHLWFRQISAILALEARRNLFSRRGLFVYLLALSWVFIFGLLHVLPVPENAITSVGGESGVYALAFRIFFIRLAVFFGCVGIFTRLFRGDVLEKTLHYYFLCPVRRELLVVGKFAAGLLTTTVVFSLSTCISYFLLYSASGWVTVEEYVLNGPGLGHLFAYVGITILACLGYGAVFLLAGLLFRNPVIPAATILGWEYINFLLPAALKKISVIYYLESLCPVSISEGPVTILAAPAPIWISVPGLIGLTLAVLLISGVKVRQMEINYGSD